MIKRRKTRIVKVGNVNSVNIGYGNDIVIQSMTKCFTTDVSACCRQIRRLVKAGCDLVRVAVPTKADSQAFAQIVSKVNIPLIADIHFSSARAIEAIEAGAAKIRLNPGNIKDRKDINKIIDAAKMHNTAMRIGVNEASIRNLKDKDVPLGRRTKLMLAEMKKYVRIFENRGFYDIVLSAKSSDTVRTIEVNRLIADNFNYPIHIGLTHAGLPEDAQVPSAVAIGTLLSEGIGDTIRVSLAGDPVNEVVTAKKILSSLGLYQTSKPELVVCPTCGRSQIDVVKLARKVSKSIKQINKPVRIAVMGCVVNGPGEAADADIAICAGKSKAMLYKRGRKIATITEDELLPALLEQIEKL
jgi:(E)-4-hydroxy-3-methylbut-2-enyl-diphosphate synthase